MTRPEALSRQSTLPDYKAQAQIELVKALALAGKVDEARGVIEAINDPDYKAQAQIELVKALALAGQIDEAISVMKEINHPYCKASAMLTLVDLIFAEPTFIQRLTLPATLNEEVGAASCSGIFTEALSSRRARNKWRFSGVAYFLN